MPQVRVLVICLSERCSLHLSWLGRAAQITDQVTSTDAHGTVRQPPCFCLWQRNSIRLQKLGFTSLSSFRDYPFNPYPDAHRKGRLHVDMKPELTVCT